MKKLLLILPALIFSLSVVTESVSAKECSFNISSTYCEGSNVTMSFTANTTNMSQWPQSYFAGISGNWNQYSSGSGTLNLGALPIGTYDFYSFNEGQQCGSGVPNNTACPDCGNSGSPPSSVNSSYKKSFSVINCTPPPTCTLSGTSSITEGQSATLSWNTTNATSRTINNSVGSVGTSGSTSVSPTTTTTYILSLSGAGGTGNCSHTVTVNPIPVPTCSLSLSPVSPVSLGTQQALSWTTSNATSGTINCIGNTTPIASGSKNILQKQNLTYTMNVTGSGGNGSCSINANVSATTLSTKPWDAGDWNTKTRAERLGEITTWLTSNIVKRVQFATKPWNDAGYGVLTHSEKRDTQKEWQYLHRAVPPSGNVVINSANEKVINAHGTRSYFIPEKTVAEWNAARTAITAGSVPGLSVQTLDTCELDMEIL